MDTRTRFPTFGVAGGRPRRKKMNALFHIPSASRLQDYVTMVWEITGEQNINEVILPQGIVEIVFNFAATISGTMPQSQTILQVPRCFIQGIHTYSVHADYIGQQHLLGIRLHPYQIQTFLGILPSELNNSAIDLTLIKPGFDRLWHQLVELHSFEEKLSLLEKELPQLSEPVCSRSKYLSDLFLTGRAENFQTVDGLAQQVCYSSRQLNRVAHQLFGLSAAELTLYKKLVESVKLIHFGNNSLTDVAYSTGFYDQAHFSRVFKSYTGMTPNEYKKRKSELPFHIIS
ncbi:MAG: AraC family transcriptional regulator [Chitinophagaceae bacterium]|nr:AraC family transcriptional regulator [Chitinophagaceae bacterium]